MENAGKLERGGAPEAVLGKPRFKAMTESTADQWHDIVKADAAFGRGLPRWLVDQLMLLRNDTHAFTVDRLEHCLQAATRAFRDGRDDEYVVCALLHDVGAALAPASHANFAAMILKPYISAENHWMLQHHDIFQSYYYAHFFGHDRNRRERYRDHPCYARTVEFCHLYDQAAFDPDYPSMSLVDFGPMLWRVLTARKPL